MCCSLLWVWAADKANRNKRQTAVRSVFLRSDIQHRLTGGANCVSVFVLSGRQPFFCTDCAGCTSCVSNTPLTGGVFFAEPQREGFAAPRGGGKRVDTCGFYPLNSRFPLFLSLAHIRDRRPLQNGGTAVGLPQRVFLHLFVVHRQRTATPVVYSTRARHDCAAPCVD